MDRPARLSFSQYSQRSSTPEVSGLCADAIHLTFPALYRLPAQPLCVDFCCLQRNLSLTSERKGIVFYLGHFLKLWKASEGGSGVLGVE